MDGLVHLHVLLNQSLHLGFSLPEDLQQQGLQLLLVDGEGVAGVGTVLDLAGADPLAVLVALAIHRVPAVVGGAAAGAVELAGQQVGVVADALPGLDIVAALFQHGVGGVPQLLADDGGDDLPRLVLEHDPFLRREEFLLFGEEIDDLDLVAHVVSLVLGVGDHVGHGGVGDFFAVVVAVALLVEERLNLLHGVFPGGVQLEEPPDHGGLLLVDDQSPVVLGVAEDPVVSQDHVVLDGLLMAEFDTAAELAQLILSDAGHDGQPQLRVLVEGVDVVVLEEHAHPGGQQLPGVLDGVQGVSGKAGDLLGDDQVEQPCLGVLHHPMEVVPLFGGGRRQALVNVARHKGPGAVAPDQILIVGDLVAQRIQLLVALRGHTGVVGHPQRQVIYAPPLQLLPDHVNVHVCLSFSLYHHY